MYKHGLVITIALALGVVLVIMGFALSGMTGTARAGGPAEPDACPTPIKKNWLIKGNCGTNSNKHFIGTTDLQPLVFRTNKIERMRLGVNGNLGIGTTNPTHPLHIVGASATLRLDSTQSNGLAQTEYSTDARRYYTGVFGSTAGVLAGKYFIKDDTTGQSRFVIDSSGRVGIGTINPTSGLSVAGGADFGGNVGIGITSPVNKLSVNGGGDFSGNVGIGTNAPQHALQIGADLAGRIGFDTSDGSPNAGYLRFGDNTGWKFHIARARESSGGVLNTGTTGAIMTITDKKNVGIGTTSPENILTIVQNSDTDPIADSWTTYSSRRWKTNVVTMDHALEKIEQLRGVTFDWEANGKHDIGVIAEEVGAVFPEIVEYESNGVDAKGLDYSRLVGVLIQGIKEQQTRLDSQQKQIDTLEARLSALERAPQGQASVIAPRAGSELALNALVLSVMFALGFVLAKQSAKQ